MSLYIGYVRKFYPFMICRWGKVFWRNRLRSKSWNRWSCYRENMTAAAGSECGLVARNWRECCADQMETNKEHIRHCLLFEFDKGSTAALACRNIRQVYGEDAIDESTCRRWFRKFRNGDRSCQDQPRSGRPSAFSEEDLDQAITVSPNPTVEEFKRKPCRYIGQQWKEGFCRWVPL